MRLQKLRAGLYEAPDGSVIEHRPDIDGAWYVTAPGRSAPDNVYGTLGDARQALVAEKLGREAAHPATRRDASRRFMDLFNARPTDRDRDAVANAFLDGYEEIAWRQS